jgi:hypothetical protein
MNDLIEEKEIQDNFKLKIYYDEWCECPREYDNLTTMFCFHKRYALGDKHSYNSDEFSGWNEFKEQLENDYDILLINKLYLYDHSGISISNRSFIGRTVHAEWDSGCVGFVFVHKEQLKLIGLPETITKENLQNCIDDEVSLYDSYLRNECYRYDVVLKDDEDEIIDSCGGYFDIKDIYDEVNNTTYKIPFKKDDVNQLELF